MNKKTLFAVITAAFVALPAAAATEGKDYEVISVEVAPVHKDKIEVTEFFAYWCPHCADLDPVLLRHAKQFPRDTVLRTEHVIWDEARDYPLARLAVAVNQSGEKYRANPAIFAALVQQRINLGNEEVLRQWLPQQTSFNAAKVQAAFDSFSNATQAKQMGALTRKHGIEGTPTLIVGGKYRVIFENGYEAGMKTVDELIAKVRQERGMPAPRPAPKPTRSLGASLLKSAVTR